MSRRLLAIVPVLSLSFGCWAADAPEEETIPALEAWVAEHPSDQQARSRLLQRKVAQKESELRAVLVEQASDKDLILADPDYAAAKVRADEDVKHRLGVVEYLLGQQRTTEALAGCNGILRDHPNEPATLTIKYRIVSMLTRQERASLLKDREDRHGEAINDTIDRGRFPRDPPPVKRQVFIFPEDLAEVEREKVRARLQEPVSLELSQAKVWDVMKPLFAVGGINYVVLDSAVGDQTVSLKLQNATLESALTTVGKLAKIRFSYTDGTVFVSSDADDGLVTEIIRLRSGLTNVDAKVDATSFSGAAGGGGGGGGSTGGGNGGGNLNNPASNLGGTNGRQGRNPTAPQGATPAKPAGGGGGGGGEGKTDVEKLLDKLPELVVGWTDKCKYHIDRKSNTLFVTGTPWVISETKRLLNAVDYNNAQVLIESRFIEVTDEALRQLGVDWGAFRGTDKATTNLAGGVGAPTLPSATTAVAGQGVASGLLQQNSFTLSATLKALETESQADTLAEPKILTLNNANGVIEVTARQRYVTRYNFEYINNQSYGNNTVNGGTTVVQSAVPTPEYDEAVSGFQLTIMPSIARNSDIITLHIKPTVQEVSFTSDVQTYVPNGNSSPQTLNVQVPSYKTRTLETTLHVENGRTVALGGLADEGQNRSTSGTPFLSKIPIFGSLFKNESSGSKRKNLVVLVTAHIVDPSGAKVGEEIQHLKDTARILIPDAGDAGFDPTKPPVTRPSEPSGPKAEKAQVYDQSDKGRRR